MPMLRDSNRHTTRAVALVVAATLTAAVGLVVVPTAAGATPVHSTISFGGPPVAIPDSPGFQTPGAPASASVTSNILDSPITDIDLRIDGSSCTASAGSTTVGLDHTFVSDLQISLTSPEGTTVQVVTFLGGQNGQDGNNFCQTVFDDEAVTPFSAALGTAAPFTGSFTPNNALSAFDGEDGNGTWTLTVQDYNGQDTGSIRAFSVLVTTDPVITATKTVSGEFEEGGTVIYTITATNHTGVASGNNAGHEITDELPEGLTFVTATASAADTLGFNHNTRTLFWNGTYPANGTVTVTMTATVDAGMENETIVNQADFHFDSDGNQTNETPSVSDDPAVIGLDDPTSFTVAAIPPTVTVEQSDTQADPTAASPILFDVTFSEPVTGFTADDVTLGGTAGATTAVVSGSGADYTVAVSGMTGVGTVTVSVPAGAAEDAAGNPSEASTSVNNAVTFNPPPVLSDRDQYIDGVYQVLLARPADAPGTAFWSGQLTGGLSRADFTHAVEDSGEGIDTQIARSYLAVLDRTVDPAGRAAWHAFLDGSGTTRLLEAQLAGSPEFLAGAGGTNPGFVAEAYRELLGREVDSAGATFWQNALAAGTTRTAVAQSLLDSDEGVARQLAGAYQLVLHRAPDPAGSAFWAPVVRTGDRRFVLSQLAASDEFFALATIG